MTGTRRLTATLLALVAIAATGCGRQALNTPAAAGTMQRATAPTAMFGGKKRKLGYNVDRYKQQLAGRARTQHIVRDEALPAAVDNRQWCAPIGDQGDLGSCTAWSMGNGMREYLQRKNGEAQVPLSTLWLYYEERVRMGTVNEDSGANMIDGVSVLKAQGNATETLWPYLSGKFKVKAPDAAYASAASWKINDYTAMDGSLADIKKALANGQPVVFGFMVYSSFMWVGSNGMMPMPKPNEGIMGGHAVQAVGYDDAKQTLIVRNSWGKGWGDQGYFYMPYKFAADTEKTLEWYTAQ